MNTELLFVTSFIIFMFFSGCSKPHPEGLPPLVPCTIQVVDGKKPIGGVDVNLTRQNGHGGWTLHGRTNGNGNAQIRTSVASFQASGVPVGDYEVFVSERIDLPKELSPPQDEQMRMSSQEMAELVKKQEEYLEQNRRLSTSAIELSVSESGGTFVVDISKHR